jgi:hypothetical protein
LAPAPADLAGTVYVATKLGCTTVWVTELIKKGSMPWSIAAASTSGSNAAEYAASAVRGGACRSSKG